MRRVLPKLSEYVCKTMIVGILVTAFLANHAAFAPDFLHDLTGSHDGSSDDGDVPTPSEESETKNQVEEKEYVLLRYSFGEIGAQILKPTHTHPDLLCSEYAERVFRPPKLQG
jgi:hypothetical protein